MVKFKTLNKEKLDKTFYEKAKEKKGITLIALVVTILVLLILVGVSLNLIFGEDNGIVNRSISARNTHNRESIREKVIMAMHDLQIDGKETNADNVKADLISSNYYTDNEVEVLSDTKIKINGEVFEIDNINSNPDPVPTLAENVAWATEELTKQGITPNTKTIKQYLYDKEKYETGKIEDEPNGDLNDTLIVGKGTPEEQTAEVPTNRYTVYFEKLEYSTQPKVYAYTWYDDNGTTVSNADWPGIEITEKDGNAYKYVLPEITDGHSWQKMIFTHGDQKPQTVNLDIGGKGQVFRTADSSIIYTICPAEYNKNNFKIYAWSVEDGVETKNAAWPGTAFDGSFVDSSNNQTIYYYDMNKNGKTWQKFILNDGSNQTVDITYEGGNRKYCTIGGKVNGKWNGNYVEAYYGGQWVNRN